MKNPVSNVNIIYIPKIYKRVQWFIVSVSFLFKPVLFVKQEFHFESINFKIFINVHRKS